ncbi:sugar phosphate isomerase/epimerase [Aestuariibacter sp. AA17]|uniref:Sugar phosphate isomerase/epimerase n=1 Tax=Fluctibacter corallii TaxID=2984329 RepID=A0ABT3ACI4_9ALTE|nr:sugar phosphate isomerase/epimerase [Aestuariibacter sp. AA17]MCV2886344.1 sugar phosphate isomerase/epimerase [Aestuariibacter sp. AA17]
MTVNKRQFLQLSSTALLAGAAHPLLGQPQGVNASNIGLQLYTLRAWMSVSVEATLMLVAGAGFKEVEFAGYFQQSPKTLHTILTREGLTAPSAHIPIEDFQSRLSQLIDVALELQHRYLIIPYLTAQQRGSTIDTYYRLSEQMNQWGEQCQAHGITLAYHNHDFEFYPLDNQIPFDVLLKNTEAELIDFELDVYWVHKAKQDPLTYIRSNPGRFPLFHIKDMGHDGEIVPVGEGVIDFKRIFEQRKLAGTQHLIVELDNASHKMQGIQTGLSHIKQLLRV